MAADQAARPDAKSSYQDAPTQTISAGGTTFAYRDLGPRDRYASHLPQPPRGGPGQLGPPRRRRHRCAASGDHLRQPRRRRVEGQDAGLDRRDGEGRHRLHQGSRFRPGRSARLLDGRLRRSGHRAKSSLISSARSSSPAPVPQEAKASTRSPCSPTWTWPRAPSRSATRSTTCSSPRLRTAGQRARVPEAAEGAHREPRQGDLRPVVPGAPQGHPRLGRPAAGRPFRHPSACVRRERRPRPDGAQPQLGRPRPSTAERPAQDLPRRRPRGHLPVPREFVPKRWTSSIPTPPTRGPRS